MKEFRIVNTQTGNYGRNAQLEDILFLLECTQDWPNGAWPYSLCEDVIKTSIGKNYSVAYLNMMDGTKSLDRLCGIFCKADGSKIGFVQYSLFVSSQEGVPTGSQTFALAIHPDYRGQGLYTEFSQTLDWMTLDGQTQTSTYDAVAHEISGAVKHLGAKKDATDEGTRDNGATANYNTRYTETRENTEIAMGGFNAALYEKVEVEV